MNIEFEILNFIRENLSCAPMDAIMKFITFFGDGGWFWIVLALVLTLIPKTRKIGITVCISLLFSLVFCNLTIKPLVARTRPYDVLKTIEIIIEAPRDYSFPSGHTSISFAGAVAVFAYNKKWGSMALIFAALIAFSRLYLYVHFPTDVLAGALLGSFCAVLAYYTGKLVFRHFDTKKEI